MQLPEDISRDFGLSDAVMLFKASLAHWFLMEDLDDFIAFDPTFEDPFAADFLASIKALEGKPSDRVIMYEQAESTEIVEASMSKGRQGYRFLMFFVAKAFPDDKAVWNEFGFTDYRRNNKSQTGFFNFLKQAHQTAVKYEAELNAVGFDNVRIAEVKTLADNLLTNDLKQEELKGARSVSARKRIKELNEIWANVRLIRRAGKLIYAENYGKYQRYKGEKQATSKRHITVKVLPSSIANVVKNKFTAETSFKLHNTGTTQLLFGLCKNITQVPGVSGIILDAGAEQNLTAGMLGNYDKSHTFINVLNLSDEATGNFVLTKVK